jgi:hypothetical protein
MSRSEYMADQIRRIRDARQVISDAAGALRRPTPESMEKCGAQLSKALQLLGEASPLVAGAQGSIVEIELKALQREVGRVRHLLVSAAEMYRDWANILALATGGYGSEGQVRPVEVESRVVVEA